jgi:hypothetical protein
MSKNIILTQTEINSSANKIIFFQETDACFKRYFRENLFIEYDIDLTFVPKAVLNITFVANIYPICWFLGATLKVKTLDKNFYESIEKVKHEFAKFYPEILSRNSKLLVENLESIEYSNHNEAMLFSGGVDALYSYSKIESHNIQLVTIHGADIDIQNNLQWEKIKGITNSLVLTEKNSNYFIRSNVRSFYRSKVEKLIFNNTQDWWTLVQHGLSLTTSLSPIAYLNSVGKVYIGSTFEFEKNDLPWGSSYIDNFIAFGKTEVVHHGQDANRLEKMKFLCDYFEKVNVPTPFRVCYQQLNTKLNCSICAKCYRAIITLIILGKDPRKYGFDIEITTNSVELFYDNLAIFIQKNVFNQSVYFYWLEILDEMNKNNNSPFIFFNEAIEIKKIIELNDLLQKLKFKKKTWKTSIKENLNSYRRKWFQTINKLNQK